MTTKGVNSPSLRCASSAAAMNTAPWPTSPNIMPNISMKLMLNSPVGLTSP